MIGNDLGEFWIEDGFSMRVVRERLGHQIKELGSIWAWRNMIRKEEEW
jgi:hypothetical protein